MKICQVEEEESVEGGETEGKSASEKASGAAEKVGDKKVADKDDDSFSDPAALAGSPARPQ